MAQNDAYIWGYLKAHLNDNEYGAAAIMGNLYAESGLYPNNLQNDFNNSLNMTDLGYTQAVNSGEYTREQFINDSAGYGLAQWTYPTRKQALYDRWVDGGYPSIANVDLQLSFLLYELEHSYSDVFAVCKTTDNIRDASDIFLHEFENPADQSESVEEKREGFAQGYYDLYTGTYGDYTGESPPNEPVTPTKRKSMSKLLLYAVGSDIV